MVFCFLEAAELVVEHIQVDGLIIPALQIGSGPMPNNTMTREYSTLSGELALDSKIKFGLPLLLDSHSWLVDSILNRLCSLLLTMESLRHLTFSQPWQTLRELISWTTQQPSTLTLMEWQRKISSTIRQLLASIESRVWAKTSKGKNSSPQLKAWNIHSWELSGTLKFLSQIPLWSLLTKISMGPSLNMSRRLVLLHLQLIAWPELLHTIMMQPAGHIYSDWSTCYTNLI